MVSLRLFTRGVVRSSAADAAAARSARQGADQDNIQSPIGLYKALTDYIKPRKGTQRHKVLDKALMIIYKDL